jgi:hypothetical protein
MSGGSTISGRCLAARETEGLDGRGEVAQGARVVGPDPVELAGLRAQHFYGVVSATGAAVYPIIQDFTPGHDRMMRGGLERGHCNVRGKS